MTDSYDVKRALRELYAPKPGGFGIVDVQPLTFLMTDGHGEPNTSPAYAAAVQGALHGVVRRPRDRHQTLGRVHTVGPLERLWSAEAMSTFVTRGESARDWTFLRRPGTPI